MRWRNEFEQRKTLGLIKTMEELIEKLQTDQGKENLKYTYNKRSYSLESKVIKIDGRDHLIFWDPNLLELAKNSKTWHLDATFKAIPRIKKVQQLLTIMAREYDQVQLI